MKPTEAGRDDNVISLTFKQDYDPNAISHDISHPASKHFIDDDPLNDLLTEFDDLVDEEDELIEEEDTFIFHHQKPWDYQVQLYDDVRSMADTILDQIKRLKEDSKRLKYYLDEMNLD